MIIDFRTLACLVVAGAAALTACASPSPGVGANPDPEPNIYMPAACTSVPLSRADEFAAAIGVDPTSIRRYWENDDSAFLTTGERCLTDQEFRFLDSLEQAVGEGIAPQESVAYWLGRHDTVGELTNEAFDLTARIARQTSTQMPKILATVPFGTVIQPTGNLPGTLAARDSEGNLFTPYPVNELVGSWAFATWGIPDDRGMFQGKFVSGLSEGCNDDGQLITQSMDVLFNAFEFPLDTPVYLGSLLPATLTNVAYGMYPGAPGVEDARIFFSMMVPHDDRSVFAPNGTMTSMNLTRGDELTFWYVHVVKSTATVTPADVGRTFAPGALIGDTYGGIFDFTVGMPARHDYHQDDIPRGFPNLGVQRYSAGEYIFDPVMAAYVDEAKAGGIPEDMIIALDLPRYRVPSTFYQGTCKPLE